MTSLNTRSFVYLGEDVKKLGDLPYKMELRWGDKGVLLS